MSGRRHKSAASTDRQVITLKLLVDKTRNRVLFAEADHEFIDTLFSFLTLPLGTILRLMGPDMAAMGSISRVYASVSALEPRYLRSPYCKPMLLSPINSSESQCSKLKLNINHSEPAVKFYRCYLDCYYHLENGSVAVFKNERCPCSNLMDIEVKLADQKDSLSPNSSGDGAFVNSETTNFMITDDLQVVPASSTGAYIGLLRKLGIKDGNEIEDRTVQIGIEEVLQLLKFSVLSKSPLTEALLPNQHGHVKDIVKCEYKKRAQSNKKAMAANSSSMSLKILVSKSKKRILYAEAGVDVVDFLFSFLTIPLGTMVKLLGRNSSLGCIDNLYKAAEELSDGNYIKSEECKKMLVCPKLFPHFGFENHPLQIDEYPQYVFGSRGMLRLVTDANVETRGSVGESSEEKGRVAHFLDPKSPTGETVPGKGYLKVSAIFTITDNLTVTPLSPISSIAILNQLEVSINDVEERIVTVGKVEALNLLKASLISDTPLTDVFNWRDPFPEIMLKV